LSSAGLYSVVQYHLARVATVTATVSKRRPTNAKDPASTLTSTKAEATTTSKPAPAAAPVPVAPANEFRAGKLGAGEF